MKTPLIVALAAMLPALQPQAAPQGRTVTFALSGDSIITQKLSVHSEPEFLRLVETIRSADVAFTNLEMLFHDYEPYPSAQSGGTYMRAEPAILKDLLWAGFDMVSLANNHSVDYGIEGMRISREWVRKSGLTHAGVGENLTLARAPGYLDSAAGRVALISCASTFPPFGMAGPARPDVHGRPGLNPLRYTTTYKLDAGTMDALRIVNSSLPGSRRSRDPKVLTFLGTRFELSDRNEIVTVPDRQDLKEITDTVRSARKQADWVVVAIHAHESIPGDRERPAQFVETFARAVIDAGADMFVGHGPHILKGVEIYKGKPIFYSLANFIFQNETVEFLPAENYLPYGLGHDATPAEFSDQRYQNDTIGFPADDRNWESVVALPQFSDGRLVRIELVPIVLGQKKPRPQRGRPVVADAADGQRILQHLGDLSKPYGTSIRVENNRGIVIP